MSVHLHTPTQAEQLSAATTRQLEGIADAARIALNSAGLGWTEAKSPPPETDPDQTVCHLEIGVDTFFNSERNPNALVIRPRYPGASITHDIELLGRSSGVTNNTVGWRTDNIRTLMEADHYGSFSPLPPALTTAAGLIPISNDNALHLLFVLAGSRAVLPPLQHDIDELCRVIASLETNHSVAAVTVMPGPDIAGCENRSVEEIAAQLNLIAQGVTQKTDIPVFTLNQNVCDSTWLPALFGKFDVALFAGCQRYADAVELGVPVYTWRINESLPDLNFWLDEIKALKWSQQKNTINLHQKQFLRERNTPSGDIIRNNRSQFAHVLLTHLVQQLPNHGLPLPASDDSALPVIATNTSHYPGSQNQSARHVLTSTQRKLQKLRQSPKRFIRDSDTRLAKFIQPYLRDPAA